MPTATDQRDARQDERQLFLSLAATAGLLGACATVFITSVATTAAPHLSEPAAPSPPPLINQASASPLPASTSTPVPSPSRLRGPRGCRGGRRSQRAHLAAVAHAA
eukprot:650529-Pleurochrysis_carterae.AAC.1